MSTGLASCAWNVRKVRIALRLRRETTMRLKWLAEQLAMVTWSNVGDDCKEQNLKKRVTPLGKGSGS